MQISRTAIASVAAAAGLAVAIPQAAAQPVELRITVTNMAPQNSVSFAPLRVGFGNGTYDSFNNGEASGAAIISIAEGGSGSDWFPAFMAAEPNATLGTVVPNPPGPLLPGGVASNTFVVDPAVNRFFTFGAMVVPSNDYFIGNDSPTQYQVLDAAGNLQITSIMQRGRDIWDAGSETTDAAAAAFLMGGDNSLRTPQNGVVNFDFADLASFNGLTTAAGYKFQSQLAADTAVYRIDFEIVPAPGALALMGVSGLALLRRRR